MYEARDPPTTHKLSIHVSIGVIASCYPPLLHWEVFSAIQARAASTVAKIFIRN